MRLATIITDGQESLAICHTGFVRIRDLNREFKSQWPETMEQLLTTNSLIALNDWSRQKGRFVLDDPLARLSLRAEARAYAPLTGIRRIAGFGPLKNPVIDLKHPGV